MTIKPIIEEIEKEVIDVTETTFVHNVTEVVPGISDTGLTYESGKDKKGKKITTCVLYVDIRNSLALTEKHHTQTMGRVYTAFTKAVLKLARHHKGHTRNIIGDRVMILFPSKNCYKNAVHCAISINHVAEKIINKQFNVDFMCGIGVDHGELRVIKVGIQRNGTENGENKGLVWVGYPANLASRLTDVANKTMEEEYYEVIRYPINPRAIKPAYPSLAALIGNSSFDPNAPLFLNHTEKVELSINEFADSFRHLDNGSLYSVGGKIVKFQKKIRRYKFPPILLSENVFKGYKAAVPNASDIKNNWWNDQNYPIPNVKGKVYGKNLTWDI